MYCIINVYAIIIAYKLGTEVYMKKLIATATALGILTTGIYMPNNYNSALVSITASAITMDGKYIYDSETGIKMTVYGEICDSWDVDYGYHKDYINILRKIKIEKKINMYQVHYNCYLENNYYFFVI